MAQDSSNIIGRWSMKEFFVNNGRTLQRVPCTNGTTGDSFCMLAFGRKFVGFSKELGELTNAQVNSMKEDLQIVELKVPEDVRKSRRDAGKQEESYRLCRKGESTWEEVQLTGW